ncbi:SCO family protein [Pokkaliibacter sp. CJK22405]|uniref:SCO family protein n=1 Tax=Pokkaliibacter sp. CJK22405 TaxID=3384615 RepID=UPI003984D208
MSEQPASSNTAPQELNFFQRYIFWIIFGCALTAVTGVISYLSYVQSTAPRGPFAHMGGDFTLQSVNGPVSLEDYRGKVVVLYFGYTSCPDVCPTEMALLGNAIHSLSKEEQANVQGIFIGVDPERDKLDTLDGYAKFFYPNFVGVTGTVDELHQVAGAYGAYYRKVEMKDSALGYGIDHSSYFFVINKDGRLVNTIGHSSDVKAIAAGLKPYIDAKS